jgi:hypothetical protein
MNIGVEWVGGRWDQMLAAEALVMTEGTCFTGSILRAVTCFGVNDPRRFLLPLLLCMTILTLTASIQHDNSCDLFNLSYQVTILLSKYILLIPQLLLFSLRSVCTF